ncbi:MAG: hypothetical protein OQK69_02525, partial [Gammaproteobacteria bacterium]|nr:hypothetical protein [Gammaproteobacteria bacterium]
MFVTSDLTAFKKLFAEKLRSMLSPDELGAFILVLANSMQDKQSKADLKDDLMAMFVELNNRHKEGLLKAT